MATSTINKYQQPTCETRAIHTFLGIEQFPGKIISVQIIGRDYQPQYPIFFFLPDIYHSLALP